MSPDFYDLFLIELIIFIIKQTFSFASLSHSTSGSSSNSNKPHNTNEKKKGIVNADSYENKKIKTNSVCISPVIRVSSF
jgi:hypothetical protein